MDSDNKKSAPVGAADRITSLDFIRGIAVLGILASNIVTYARPNEARRVVALVHEVTWNEWFPWLGELHRHRRQIPQHVRGAVRRWTGGVHREGPRARRASAVAAAAPAVLARGVRCAALRVSFRRRHPAPVRAAGHGGVMDGVLESAAAAGIGSAAAMHRHRDVHTRTVARRRCRKRLRCRRRRIHPSASSTKNTGRNSATRSPRKAASWQMAAWATSLRTASRMQTG